MGWRLFEVKEPATNKRMRLSTDPFVAAKQVCIAMIELLVEFHADINAREKTGTTPTTMAVVNN